MSHCTVESTRKAPKSIKIPPKKTKKTLLRYHRFDERGAVGPVGKPNTRADRLAAAADDGCDWTSRAVIIKRLTNRPKDAILMLMSGFANGLVKVTHGDAQICGQRTYGGGRVSKLVCHRTVRYPCDRFVNTFLHPIDRSDRHKRR